MSTFLVLVLSLFTIAWQQDRVIARATALPQPIRASAEHVLIETTGSAAAPVITETNLKDLVAAGGRALPSRVMGRVAEVRSETPGTGIRHQWPGIYAEAAFGGDALAVAFDDPINRYRITVDDGAGPVVLITRPERRAFLISGLGPGRHEVRLDKVSQSSEPGSFLGFHVPRGGLSAPPPRPLGRQIEFVGDSDSVGYGNMAPHRDCTDEEIFQWTDTARSFAPQIARHFGADYQIMAASGIGLVRNYGPPDPGHTMMSLYPRVVFGEPSPWSGAAWRPDLLVLALGSNDFALPLGLGEQWPDETALRQDFEAHYRAFIRHLRVRNPDAFILLVALRDYGATYLAAQEAIVQTLREAGDLRVALLALPEMERTACDWHPSLKDHRSAAAQIIRFVEGRPDIWRQDRGDAVNPSP
ncbi:lipase [Rubellimicrobium rubrum]|uniref:Lipase n=1 Tax=Rubellimicrobium rubrum TaxID=2585369 RepID=A0A5C4MU84_9RHOB|nr:SGNH/GDSL hydrolase family protein [Rubellimicrobium rubrum]TNC49141.1 lipase [Rubellimicrobium rubrum]